MDSHGKPKKEFRQFTDSPYPRIPDVRPLYNIPNIVASDKVIWVEGEKCADALNEIGLHCNLHYGWCRNVIS